MELPLHGRSHFLLGSVDGQFQCIGGFETRLTDAANDIRLEHDHLMFSNEIFPYTGFGLRTTADPGSQRLQRVIKSIKATKSRRLSVPGNKIRFI